MLVFAWETLAARLMTFLALMQNQPPKEAPAPPSSGVTNYQPYVFWAYAAVCLLILLFTFWTLAQASRLSRKVDYLEGRFREAHPDE